MQRESRRRRRRRVAARAQRHEGRGAKHQRDRAAGGKPEIVAAGFLRRDDRKGVLAGDDERLLVELKPRVGLRHASPEDRRGPALPTGRGSAVPRASMVIRSVFIVGIRQLVAVKRGHVGELHRVAAARASEVLAQAPGGLRAAHRLLLTGDAEAVRSRLPAARRWRG